MAAILRIMQPTETDGSISENGKLCQIHKFISLSLGQSFLMIGTPISAFLRSPKM
jgi:hypothetical protein